jgi:hypothetical protein
MGIIGDAFGKLFRFLGSIFSNLFGVIWDGLKWVVKQLGKFLQNILDVLIAFFEVIYDLIKGLLYLLYMIGVLAAKLFLVIFEAAKVLWALVVGFAKTLGSLTYTPTSGSGNGYSSMIGKIFTYLEPLQLNIVAYILLFVLWFVTAVSAMKLISSMRG